ncbi:MAG TPA: tetratricopeptide repeat protein, partial [Myxococcaceae bacterium]|nr:tetratricopeptide repeat protein [Myxococcaceae bacterium]
PSYTEAALNLAVIYNDLGKYGEAREVYQAALSRQKRTPGTMDTYVRGKIANMYADIAGAYASSGMIGEAIAEYRRALDLCPTFIDIRLRLGDAYRDQGQLEEAVAQYEEIIRQNPSYLPARLHYGIALYSAGRKDEAARTWEELLSLSPGHRAAEMYLKLARDGVPTA